MPSTVDTTRRRGRARGGRPLDQQGILRSHDAVVREVALEWADARLRRGHEPRRRERRRAHRKAEKLDSLHARLGTRRARLREEKASDDDARESGAVVMLAARETATSSNRRACARGEAKGTAQAARTERDVVAIRRWRVARVLHLLAQTACGQELSGLAARALGDEHIWSEQVTRQRKRLRRTRACGRALSTTTARGSATARRERGYSLGAGTAELLTLSRARRRS